VKNEKNSCRKEGNMRIKKGERDEKWLEQKLRGGGKIREGEGVK
jgi:hypothetical protein